jgi:hypothetical protein
MILFIADYKTVMRPKKINTQKILILMLFISKNSIKIAS